MEVDLTANPYTLTHAETNTHTHTQTHRIINHARIFEIKDLIILTLAILMIRELLLLIKYFGRTSSHLFKLKLTHKIMLKVFTSLF